MKERLRSQRDRANPNGNFCALQLNEVLNTTLDSGLAESTLQPEHFTAKKSHDSVATSQVCQLILNT